MIVVAIIGILAAVALPAYQDYTKRAKLSEVILAASACRTAVSEYVQANGSVAGSASAWGCTATASKYVSGVVVTATTGVITATIQNIGGMGTGAITLSPSSATNSYTALTATAPAIASWRCSGTGSVSANLRPSTCRD
jgi:type IV pilus assembly protein PilA